MRSQVHDFIEEALPANSGVDDKTLEGLVGGFIGEGMASQVASEGLASQTSMSLDAFFAACHTSQVARPDADADADDTALWIAS